MSRTPLQMANNVIRMHYRSSAEDYIDFARDSALSMAKQLVDLESRISELVESEEKAWQTVAKLRVELETTDRLRLRVKELEEAARKVCSKPLGNRRTTCNSEALSDLDDLLPYLEHNL